MITPRLIHAANIKALERLKAEYDLDPYEISREEWETLPVQNQISLRRHLDETRSRKTALTTLPRTMLLLYVSLFDEFLARIVKFLILRKPHILDTSDKVIRPSELLQFTSMKAVREYLIDSQVEHVLRSSHSSQFKWLEKQLDRTLTKGLEVWPKFIELTERRNLLAHSGGIVSEQYITVCRKHDVKLPKGLRKGDLLEIKPAYLMEAHGVLLEIGMKLSFVVWRLLLPNNIEDADVKYNCTCVELLTSREYDLVVRLLEFSALGMKNHGSEQIMRMMAVNLASAYNLSDKNDDANRILDLFDWSAASLDFQICVAAIKRDYKESAKLMREIGASGKVTKKDYLEWPIFRKFRETSQFKKSYKTIFGEAFKRTNWVDIGKEDIQGAFQEITNSGKSKSSASKTKDKKKAQSKKSTKGKKK